MLTQRHRHRRMLFAFSLAVAALSAAVRQANAQVPDATRDSITAVVQELFAAMARRDSAAARRVLFPDGYSIAQGPRGDSLATVALSHPDFLARIGRETVPWRERIWNPLVRVHHNLAMLWAPYDIRVGDEFSHCGVDVFTLFRIRNEWKIAGIAYTVEPTGCTGPESDGGS